MTQDSEWPIIPSVIQDSDQLAQFDEAPEEQPGQTAPRGQLGQYRGYFYRSPTRGTTPAKSVNGSVTVWTSSAQVPSTWAQTLRKASLRLVAEASKVVCCREAEMRESCQYGPCLGKQVLCDLTLGSRAPGLWPQSLLRGNYEGRNS